MLGWLCNESKVHGGENSWKRYDLTRLLIGSNNNSRIAGGGGSGGGEFPVPFGQVCLLVDSDDGVMAAVETLRSEMMAAGRR